MLKIIWDDLDSLISNEASVSRLAILQSEYGVDRRCGHILRE